jgi:hypothetical protein
VLCFAALPLESDVPCCWITDEEVGNVKEFEDEDGLLSLEASAMSFFFL